MTTSFFSDRYREVKQIPGLPPNVRIRMDNSTHWICQCNREDVGGAYEYTLISNYLEVYRFKWSGSKTNEYSTENANIYIKYPHLTSADNSPEVIYCRNIDMTLKQLPDFAIDVLQTTGNTAGYETIRRIANAFYSKFH